MPAPNVALANNIGAPVQMDQPYVGMTPVEAQKQMASDRERAQTQLDASDKEAAQVVNNNAQLTKFQQLNAGVLTGTSYLDRSSLYYREHLANDPKMQEMEAISDQQVPLAKENSGITRTTNVDMPYFAGQAPGLDKSKAANDQIIANIRVRNQQALDYNRFQHDYVRVNGNLLGAPDAWDAYQAANPLMNNDGKGNYTLNPGRQDYKTWFKGHMDPSSGQFRDGGASGATVPAPAPGATNLPAPGTVLPPMGNTGMPDPAQFKGQIINNGSQRMTSDGTRWVPIPAAAPPAPPAAAPAPAAAPPMQGRYRPGPTVGTVVPLMPNGSDVLGPNGQPMVLPDNDAPAGTRTSMQMPPPRTRGDMMAQALQMAA